jgi:hypothetical protein
MNEGKRLYSLENQKLSKSMINSYISCPFQFHKVFVEGDNRLDDNFFPFIYGRTIHEIFNNFYNGESNDINRLIQNIVLTKDFHKHKDIINKFISFNLDLKKEFGNNFIPYKREFKIINRKINVSGIIDRVQFDGQNYYIIDYKQKGADYNNVKECLNPYRFELALYTYLFEKETEISIKGWGIYFCKTGKLIWEERSQVEIFKCLKLIKEVRQKINEELKNKEEIKRCEICRYCKEYSRT